MWGKTGGEMLPRATHLLLHPPLQYASKSHTTAKCSSESLVIHPRLAARQVPPHHAHPGTPPCWEEQSRHKHVILCKTNCEGRAGRPISVGSAAGEVSCPLRAGVASVYFITTTRAGLLHGAGTMLRQVQNAQMQMIIKQRFENVPGRAAAGRGCRG